MNSLLSSNVPDPSDFPSNAIAPGLRTLDAALRCNICGELFDAPVTLPCGHCFCSFCLRTAMAGKQECPACRKTANEGHLRLNPVMEEVVAAWKLSRPYTLRLSKEDEQRTHASPPKSKKRKIAPDQPRQSGSGVNGVLASGSPLKPKKLLVDDGEMTIPTSDADEDEMPMLHADPRPDELISCPMCNKDVKYRSINQHLDKSCQDPPAKLHWEKIMSGSKKGKQKDDCDVEDNLPLPKASYATLKDRQLKDMLLEHNLPTTGDRNLWIQRHQRWVMIYNANLDRSQTVRKTTVELRKELKRWEDEKSKKRKTVVEDGLAYQKRHKDEFAKLVDAARSSGKPSSTPKGSPMEGGGGNATEPLLSSVSNLQSLPSPDEDITIADPKERGKSRYFS